MRTGTKIMIGVVLVGLLLVGLASLLLPSLSRARELSSTLVARSAARRAASATPAGSLPIIQRDEELWVIQRPKVSGTAADAEVPGCGMLIAKLPAEQKEIPLPLRHTDVSAWIAGYIATVEVTQQYHNPYDEKIEAVYVFPLPQNAAVNEFIMTIGNETEILREVHDRLGASRIFSFGVGSSPNRYLLNRMAKLANGAVAYLGLNDNAGAVQFIAARGTFIPIIKLNTTLLIEQGKSTSFFADSSWVFTHCYLRLTGIDSTARFWYFRAPSATPRLTEIDAMCSTLVAQSEIPGVDDAETVNEGQFLEAKPNRDQTASRSGSPLRLRHEGTDSCVLRNQCRAPHVLRLSPDSRPARARSTGAVPGTNG